MCVLWRQIKTSAQICEIRTPSWVMFRNISQPDRKLEFAVPNRYLASAPVNVGRVAAHYRPVGRFEADGLAPHEGDAHRQGLVPQAHQQRPRIEPEASKPTAESKELGRDYNSSFLHPLILPGFSRLQQVSSRFQRFTTELYRFFGDWNGVQPMLVGLGLPKYLISLQKI